jgi:hypothetical protein
MLRTCFHAYDERISSVPKKSTSGVLRGNLNPLSPVQSSPTPCYRNLECPFLSHRCIQARLAPLAPVQLEIWEARQCLVGDRAPYTCLQGGTEALALIKPASLTWPNKVRRMILQHSFLTLLRQAAVEQLAYLDRDKGSGERWEQCES